MRPADVNTWDDDDWAAFVQEALNLVEQKKGDALNTLMASVEITVELIEEGGSKTVDPHGRVPLIDAACERIDAIKALLT